MAEPQRLQKLLAQQGLASRRQVEAWILAGRVRVNGKVVTELGSKADPERDRIEVNGQVIPLAKDPARHVLLLHKPVGVLSTCADPWGRKTVLDLLPPSWKRQTRLYPVEHLADPAAQLRQFYDWLKPSGKLLINWYFFKGFNGEFPFHLDDPQKVEQFFQVLQSRFLEVFHPYFITARCYRKWDKS
jgi:hypothetical protein